MGVFFSEVYQMAVKFIFLGIVAFGGVMCGIKLRKRKNTKEGE